MMKITKEKIYIPDIHTCHDRGVVQILFAKSMCLSRAYAVLQIFHHLYTFVLQTIICANPVVVSKIFDSVCQTLSSQS